MESRQNADLKDKFSALVSEIIDNELSDNQREQFAIEGDVMIDDLFNTGDISSLNKSKDFDLDFGLSPEVIDVFKSSIEFGSIIVGCFNFYLEFRKMKSEKGHEKFGELELTKKIKMELESQNVEPHLVERISKKYEQQFHDLIKSI